MKSYLERQHRLFGIGGGGAGMIMIPTLIAVGLPPQAAVATGKMNGLGLALGGLGAFAKSGQIRKDILRVMIPVAIIVGIITPFVFVTINSGMFQTVLGSTILFSMYTPGPTTRSSHTFGKLGLYTFNSSFAGLY